MISLPIRFECDNPTTMSKYSAGLVFLQLGFLFKLMTMATLDVSDLERTVILWICRILYVLCLLISAGYCIDHFRKEPNQ